MKSKKRDFMIDYIRFTIPMPVNTIKQPFVSKKGSVIKRVELSYNPDDIMYDLVDSLELGINYSRLAEIIQNHSYFGYDKQFEIKGVQFKFMDFRKPIYNEDLDVDMVNHPVTIERDARMGICVELSGASCRSYEYYLDKRNLTLFDILKRVKFRYPDMKLTRLDLTYDIHKYMPGVKPLAMFRQSRQDLLKTHLQVYNYHGGGKFEEGSTGDTYTIGRRNSPFFMRVYDKLLERYYMHGDSWLDVDNDFWIRWEMEIKRPLSDTVLDDVIERDEGMYGFYLEYLDLLASKIWVIPTKSQIKKHDYQNIPKKVGKRTVKTPMANWWADLINPIERNQIKVRKLEHPTVINRVQKLYGSGTFFDKLAIHIAKRGNPFKLIAHWISQGKLKKNSEDFEALIEMIKDSHYDPELIDNCYSDEEAMTIINNAYNFDKYNFDLERQSYVIENTDDAFKKKRGPIDEN